jgi:hypothetical protein
LPYKYAGRDATAGKQSASSFSMLLATTAKRPGVKRQTLLRSEKLASDFGIGSGRYESCFAALRCRPYQRKVKYSF